MLNLHAIADSVLAEDSAEESAVEVALEYLKNEPTPPPRCRYPKVPMLSERRGESAATPAEDADPTPPLTDLQKHDRRFHPKGYKKGDACKYRETLAKTDNADDLTAAEREEHKEKYGNLSVKKRDEYFRLMSKKHPELDAEATLAEIGKITDPKVQKDAFAWVMRGAVRLPEDLYKVEQARELAGKAKKDPMSYDTPQACINDLLGKGHKVSLKPITVEELKKDPRFSDYKKLPYGVETFEVEDSKEGQKRMRDVLDTHWGKDANPWCLLARGSGDDLTDEAINRHAFEWYDYELTDEEKAKFDENADDFVEKVESAYKKEKADEVALHRAWDYWNHYNALPKRVAFKDGKLLAFMATHAMDEDEAFDDAAYGTGGKLPDMYPDEYKEYEDWEETEEGQEESANFFEWLRVNYPELISDEGLREHTAEEWWDRQDRPHKGIPLGNIPVEGDPYGRWADVEIQGGKAMPIMTYSHYTIENGKPVYSIDWHKGEKGSNGYVSWYENGQKKEELKDGKQQAWYENGDLKQKTYDDMTAHFQKDGKISLLKNYGSNTIRTPMDVSFWDNGKPASISIKLYNAFAPGGHGDANLVLRRDGTLSPESTLSPVMSEQEIRAKADALIAEAKRRFPNGGKQPAPSPEAQTSVDQFPAFNPASFAAYLAKH